MSRPDGPFGSAPVRVLVVVGIAAADTFDAAFERFHGVLGVVALARARSAGEHPAMGEGT